MGGSCQAAGSVTASRRGPSLSLGEAEARALGNRAGTLPVSTREPTKELESDVEVIARVVVVLFLQSLFAAWTAMRSQRARYQRVCFLGSLP